jgi:argininosuccinate lyase
VAFSPEYVRLVLNENFEDAKTLLLEPMMALHEAHLVMLAEQRIISQDDAGRIREALAGLDRAAIRASCYTGACEDLFFHIDGLIAASCGPEVAGRLHTARSRNDMAMTMYRIQLRGYLLGLLDAVIDTRRSLLAAAARNVQTIYPAHTHTQPAQPTTVAHYLHAVVEERERDTRRLLAAFDATNQNPLGACAITGTGFSIDRDRTAELLGFDRPTGNTYGSIASADYLLESTAAAGVTLVGLGRFVQDMLLWCTQEMGFLRLADGFVQVSSIMPQKRNPVALEHARALLSKAHGGMQAVSSMIHNTPFGDIVDTEDDLQPLVAGAFRDAMRGVSLVAAAMADAEFDAVRMRERAGESWVTITELADTLTRDHDVPFVAAHKIATRLIRSAKASPDAQHADLLAEAARELVGREIRLSKPDLARVLSPEHFINIRQTPGGPSSEVMSQALAESQRQLARDAATIGTLKSALSAADENRAKALRDI